MRQHMCLIDAFAICAKISCAGPAHEVACTFDMKVSKGAKIRNRYNQIPHLTQDANGKVTNSKLDNTNDSQEVSLFPAGDHKAHINRRVQVFIRN